jgi:photosystem II stability/assembly factor-like uncharacterized protein
LRTALRDRKSLGWIVLVVAVTASRLVLRNARPNDVVSPDSRSGAIVDACDNCRPVKAGQPLPDAPLAVLARIKAERGEGGGILRADHFHAARAYPRNTIPLGAFQAAYAAISAASSSPPRGGRTGIGAIRGDAEMFADTPAQALPGAGVWSPLGPAPIKNGQPAYCDADLIRSSGRVSAVALAPDDPDVVYIGSATGGVWKSTDAGQNWVALMSDEASLSIGALAIDPRNSDIVYAGTGEGKVGYYWGTGVLKSTDAGDTWELLGADVFRDRGISALIIDPQDSARLYVTSVPGGNFRSGDGPESPPATGLFMSEDSGRSWSRLTTGRNGLPAGALGWDVVAAPGETGVVYAALGSNVQGQPASVVYRSNDAGRTWEPLLQASNPANYNPPRMKLAVTASAPDRVLAGMGPLISDSGDVDSAIYASDDRGDNWAPLMAGGFCAGQCSYDMVVSTDPTDASVLYAGGVTLYKSTDGGSRWSEIACHEGGTSIHADQHALVVGEADPDVLYSGNDGGLFRSADGGRSWTSINEGLELTQFIGIAVHPDNANVVIGGTQDNGTNLYEGQPVWDHVLDGDGGFTLIDPYDPTTMYTQYYNLSGSQIGPVRLEQQRDGSWKEHLLLTQFWQGRLVSDTGFNIDDEVLFYAPIAMDPVNSSILYYGTDRLYRSTNRGDRFEPITPRLTDGEDWRSGLSTIAVAPSDSKTLYIGTSDGHIAVARDGESFRRAESGTPGRFVSEFAVDPSDPDRAWVGISGFDENTPGEPGHVFKTDNAGGRWADASSGLPNLPVNTIVLDPENPDTLFAGTDYGVYRSDDGADSWTRFSEGLPNVVIADLVVHAPSRTLVAGTHGRGTWRVQLDDDPDVATPTEHPTASATASTTPSPHATVTPGGPPTVTRTATNTPRATATPSVPPPSPTSPAGECRNIVSNGGFETGSAAPWLLTGLDQVVYSAEDLPVAPHGGAYAAQLCGCDSTTESMYQTVAIPTGASATLGFAWYMETEEEVGPLDFLEVQLRAPGGDVAETLRTLSDRSSRGQWVEERFDVSSYQGMTLELAFVGTTNEARPTTFLIDDVVLEVCGTGPAPTASAGEAAVFVSPPDAVVGIGETTTVDIRVDGAADLYGFEISMSFDPSKVRAVGEPQLGDVFAGKAAREYASSIDNQAGRVVHSVVLRGAAAGVRGSGVLSRISFVGLAEGSTSLLLERRTSIADSRANRIEHTRHHGELRVVTAGAQLTGQVRLHGRADHSGARVTTGDSSAITNAAGDFVLGGVTGVVNVRATMPGYLSALRSGLLVANAPVDLGDVVLPGGDANADESIDLLDGVIIDRNYDRPVPPGDPRADINSDGRVSIEDAALVAVNFGMSGPVAWNRGMAASGSAPGSDRIAAPAPELGRLLALRDAPASAPLQQLPVLRLEPEQVVVSANDTFEMDVFLDGDAALQGFDLVLTYDPTKIQVVGEPAPGALLGGHDVQVLRNEVDETTGRIAFALVVRGTEGIRGPGSLAKLTLQAATNGRSHIVLSPATVLTDGEGRRVEAEMRAGEVLVGAMLPTPTPARTATPPAIPTPPAGVEGIYGRLTLAREPLANAPIGLYAFSNGNLEVVAAGLTDGAGWYQFAGAPSVGPDELYVVGFVNVDDDPRMLAAAVGNLLEVYNGGDTVYGGDLEVADVRLVRPDTTAALRYPVSFKWVRRGIPDDQYLLHIFGVDNRPDVGLYPEWVDPLGTKSSGLFVSRRLPGFAHEKQYFWDVYVFRQATLGLSRETLQVMFAGGPPEWPALMPRLLTSRAPVPR